jgi:hypothetical protein
MRTDDIGRLAVRLRERELCVRDFRLGPDGRCVDLWSVSLYGTMRTRAYAAVGCQSHIDKLRDSGLRELVSEFYYVAPVGVRVRVPGWAGLVAGTKMSKRCQSRAVSAERLVAQLRTALRYSHRACASARDTIRELSGPAERIRHAARQEVLAEVADYDVKVKALGEVLVKLGLGPGADRWQIAEVLRRNERAKAVSALLDAASLVSRLAESLRVRT